MTAPPHTPDGDPAGENLTDAQQATMDAFLAQLEREVPLTAEPSPAEVAGHQARRRCAHVLAGYRQLHEVFRYYRAAGFTTDQALRLLAYTITANGARQ